MEQGTQQSCSKCMSHFLREPHNFRTTGRRHCGNSNLHINRSPLPSQSLPITPMGSQPSPFLPRELSQVAEPWPDGEFCAAMKNILPGMFSRLKDPGFIANRWLTHACTPPSLICPSLTVITANYRDHTDIFPLDLWENTLFSSRLPEFTSQ